ncbi:phosphopantetheine-binding protein [Streptomyces coeruleorubidus]|uniref:phosphopantetheine-binding protein n=1 Tax=Streptomyces coeruleorubidus TaxID=116188 RepID=UPI00379AB8BE
MSAEAAAIVREFFTRRFPDTVIEDGDDIFALGLATSLFTMELVRFVERTFGFEVPDREMHMDNFRSIDAMSLLVARMKATTPAG